jgi:hypothetical protein
MIAWDFVTHHQRANHSTEQVIRVALKRQFIDLGSVIIRNDYLLNSDALFLSDSLFTRDIFARDFFFIEALQKLMPSDSIKFIHRCLLFHQ